MESTKSQIVRFRGMSESEIWASEPWINHLLLCWSLKTTLRIKTEWNNPKRILKKYGVRNITFLRTFWVNRTFWMDELDSHWTSLTVNLTLDIVPKLNLTHHFTLSWTWPWTSNYDLAFLHHLERCPSKVPYYTTELTFLLLKHPVTAMNTSQITLWAWRCIWDRMWNCCLQKQVSPWL